MIVDASYNEIISLHAMLAFCSNVVLKTYSKHTYTLNSKNY